jgi:hypothetical protein
MIVMAAKTCESGRSEDLFPIAPFLRDEFAFLI